MNAQSDDDCHLMTFGVLCVCVSVCVCVLFTILFRQVASAANDTD